jgi:hypothetical protein
MQVFQILRGERAPLLDPELPINSGARECLYVSAMIAGGFIGASGVVVSSLRAHSTRSDYVSNGIALCSSLLLTFYCFVHVVLYQLDKKKRQQEYLIGYYKICRVFYKELERVQTGLQQILTYERCSGSSTESMVIDEVSDEGWTKKINSLLNDIHKDINSFYDHIRSIKFKFSNNKPLTCNITLQEKKELKGIVKKLKSCLPAKESGSLGVLLKKIREGLEELSEIADGHSDITGLELPLEASSYSAIANRFDGVVYSDAIVNIAPAISGE